MLNCAKSNEQMALEELLKKWLKHVGCKQIYMLAPRALKHLGCKTNFRFFEYSYC